LDDLKEFEYQLPPGLIAEKPLPDRDQSRLMVLNRMEESCRHSVFASLPTYLRAGDVLVLNDTRVIPAKISARRASGGIVRLLLLRQEPNRIGIWQAMASPIKRLKPGQELLVQARSGIAHSLKIVDFFVAEDGFKRLRIDLGGGDNVYKLLSEIGSAPLPPYIRRAPDFASQEDLEALDALDERDGPDEQRRGRLEDSGGGTSKGAGHQESDALTEDVGALRQFDLERYQTVFARAPGAVAAPTAGLHFTEALLAEIAKQGVEICRLTLHVGPGTFKPIEHSIDDHFIEPEVFYIDQITAACVTAAKKAGRRVIAVGTTSLRALESAPTADGGIRCVQGEATNLYVKPGHKFRVVDALITNFHLSRSSLLVLVAAFAGREFILRAYEEAIAKSYRFYSYGDAMLIL
jgi:S-adenosylmethionine:tRNA ribosyltransferase-isomerase